MRKSTQNLREVVNLPEVMVVLVLLFSANAFTLDRLEVQLLDSVTIEGVPGKAVTLTHLTDPAIYQQTEMTGVDGIAVFTDVATDVNETRQSVPVHFALFPNYPNPFNPSTVIPFSIQKESLVKLAIYNAQGQRVKSLINQRLSPGVHEVVWYGTTDQGVHAATGVHVARLTAGGETQTLKMLLLDGGISPAGSERRSIRLQNGRTAVPKTITQGTPYIVTVHEGATYEAVCDTVDLTPETERLIFHLTPKNTNDTPVMGGLENLSYLEDAVPADSINLETYTIDDDTVHTYEIVSQDTNIIEYELTGENNNFLKVKELKKDASGSSEIVLRVTDPHGKSSIYTIITNVSEQDDLRGIVEDHQHKVRRAGVVNINGTDYPIGEDGSFDVQVAPQDTHTVVARQYDGDNPYSFKRTIEVPGNGDNNDLVVRVVDYTGLSSDTSGVTPEKFKEFVKQLNTNPQLNAEYEGLKKFDYDSLVVWVAYDNNWTDDTFSVEQQERVRDRFINEILPNFLGRGVKEVYMEDRENPEQNPNGDIAYAVQRPDNNIPGDGEATVIDYVGNDDGVLDFGRASYRVTASNMPNTSVIDEEGGTSIGAIGIPTALKPEDSIFAVQGTGHFTIYDTKFGHILGEVTYLPKENVEKILGL